MTFEASKRAIAQIHVAKSRAIAGTGFLVAERYLLTCAHVVKEALFAPDDPLGSVLEVTFFNAAEPQQATVIFYEFEEHRYGRDAAVLYLPEDAPGAITLAPLRPLQHYNGAELQVFGYPGNDAAGRNLTTITNGEVSGGWVQIEDTKVPGLAVEAGFSGSPVWGKAEGGIVGMVVARHQGQATDKVGFMIPVQQLQAARQAVEQHSGRSLLLFSGDAFTQTNPTVRAEQEPLSMPSRGLSSSERLDLITTLNNLTPTEFEMVVSTLNPPGGIVSPSSAAQGLRSSALLQWVEGPTGPGLDEVQAVLGQVMVGASTAQNPDNPAKPSTNNTSGSSKQERLQKEIQLLEAQLDRCFEKRLLTNDPDTEVKLENLEKKLERDIALKRSELEQLN